MKILSYCIILCLFISVNTSSKAQNYLNLLTGEKIKLESFIFQSEKGYVEYSYLKPNGKIKNKYSDINDIYSITINGKDSIIYFQYEPEDFSQIEMQNVFNGRNQAFTTYNPWWAYLTGAIVGCSSMFIPINATARLLIPVVYTAGMAFASPSESNILRKYPNETNNELFIYGYKNQARKKIFKNTILGTVGGVFISGAIIGSIYLYEKK